MLDQTPCAALIALRRADTASRERGQEVLPLSPIADTRQSGDTAGKLASFRALTRWIGEAQMVDAAGDDICQRAALPSASRIAQNDESWSANVIAKGRV